MMGNDLGGLPEAVEPEKNAKIPEVVKVNNYHNRNVTVQSRQELHRT
jgi:hypothetical protein